MKFGAVQAGIRLNASCSPFDVVPPELYARFRKAVIETAKQWGLTVSFGQDDGSIAQAEQRFWQMSRVSGNAASVGHAVVQTVDGDSYFCMRCRGLFSDEIYHSGDMPQCNPEHGPTQTTDG